MVDREGQMMDTATTGELPEDSDPLQAFGQACRAELKARRASAEPQHRIPTERRRFADDFMIDVDLT